MSRNRTAGRARDGTAGADAHAPRARDLGRARTTAAGVWDLSGPITAQRTLGDVVADLLVEEIVTAAGVPPRWRTGPATWSSGLVHDKVKSLVDTGAPDPLKPNSDSMKRLAAALASTEATTVIDVGLAGRRRRHAARDRGAPAAHLSPRRQGGGAECRRPPGSQAVAAGQRQRRLEGPAEERGHTGRRSTRLRAPLRQDRPVDCRRAAAGRGRRRVAVADGGVVDCVRRRDVADLGGKSGASFGVGVASFTVSAADLGGGVRVGGGDAWRDRALGCSTSTPVSRSAATCRSWTTTPTAPPIAWSRRRLRRPGDRGARVAGAARGGPVRGRPARLVRVARRGPHLLNHYLQERHAAIDVGGGDVQRRHEAQESGRGALISSPRSSAAPTTFRRPTAAQRQRQQQAAAAHLAVAVLGRAALAGAGQIGPPIVATCSRNPARHLSRTAQPTAASAGCR